MHSSAFLKLFPPPRFMMMKYAGLDISDDAIHCLQYSSTGKRLRLEKYGTIALPEGLIDGGDTQDEKKFAEILTGFDAKHHLSYVKVSVPEEKAYLFETEVPKADLRAVEQNIEFKLEENVPLSAADAVFYFDLLAQESGKPPRASVTVVPKAYIEARIAVLRGIGITPVAFEVVPKSIARAVISPTVGPTVLIVHIMNRKTGLYVVSQGIISFTSTIGWGQGTAMVDTPVDSLCSEIERVHSYWQSHGAPGTIDAVVLVGRNATGCESQIRGGLSGLIVPIEVADVWKNIIDLDRYIPPISREESLEYAVAAGLAVGA